MKFSSLLPFAIFYLLFSAQAVLSADSPAATITAAPMQPFPVPWPKDAKSPADVSFLLPAPAGRDGFIRAQNGHLVRPNGERFRIWGFNATMQATVPPKEDAPIIAAHLARLGINCIRFHFLDRPAPNGLLDPTRDDTRALDPKQLDRLDFFIAELKKRGIYADLNLNVGRTYKAGDGVRDYELLGFPKAITYFDERLIELQKEYARQLLGHVNPYTGSAYSKEPAVALVEFVNENSIVEAWFSGRLVGQQTNKPSGTWNDIPPSYAKALTDKYNAWLAKNVSPETLAKLRSEAGVGASDPVPRLRPVQFNKASQERFHAEATFYMEVERKFFLDMSRYLREELGVKALLAGNSDHNHGRSGYPLLAATSLLDVVDGHVYWQHPRYITEKGKRSGFDIPNTAMVDDPQHSSIVQLSRSAVAGKPYTVSEVNHPFPNEYACEGIPILAAYAAFQDWDGIFWYTLGHKDILALDNAVAGHFDFARDPVKMSQLPAGALMFLRGDIRAAQRTLTRSYTPAQVRESLRLPNSEWPYFTPGFQLGLPLRHAVRISSLNGPGSGPVEEAASQPYSSDTGELSWAVEGKNSGLVTIETPRSQALIGYCRTTRKALTNFSAEVNNPFCAITLSSLDDKAIANSSKLLLTATARVANSGMEWNAKRTSLEKWGTAPTLIETVSGKIVLRNLATANQVSAQPLNGAGESFGETLSAKKTPDGWSLSVGQPATTWYVLSIMR